MALMKRLAYCINSKTKSIDFGDPFAEEITYKVVVKTGNTKAAGTDADVKIQLIGEESSTKPTKIDNFFRDDFERGKVDKFIIKMKNIGDPLLCKLVIKDKGISPDWYVEFVKVFCKGKEFFFPFYEWVTDGATTAEGTAYLPQNDKLEVKKNFREDYLRKQRTTYRWRAEPEKEDLTFGLNGHLQAEQHRDLPRNSQWSAERDAEFHNCRATGLKNLLLNRFVGIFRNFDSLEDVHKLLLVPTMKNRTINHDCWHNWRSDLEFARQQINGCRPTGVQRVFKDLPKYYSIEKSDIEKSLPSGVTYESAVIDGRIFMVDNSILEGKVLHIINFHYH
ncbi:unnamed protein product [Oikopleura dioica]|uniref:PLAT domain-containing protein n=1 Tax=Oikopleura dioica TaxID=34765 RepID=E4XHB5_OIKDI|nr:unnamed protein product [Oikopleura dioica]